MVISLALLGPFAQNLNLLCSTGAVLTPALASWLAHSFGPVCQISFSGGTELCGSCKMLKVPHLAVSLLISHRYLPVVHGTRSLPVYPGEISVKALGMDVDVFSLGGKPVPTGERGELVCKKPFPNMPVFFWNDEGRKRYFDAYFRSISSEQSRPVRHSGHPYD
jgi:acetoacetyl-CoA synthetase